MSSTISIVNNLPWLRKALKVKSTGKGTAVKILFVGRNEKTPKAFYKSAPSKEKTKINEKASVVSWTKDSNQYWIVQSKIVDPADHYGLFTPSSYAMARDLIGTCVRQIFKEDCHSLSVEYVGDLPEELTGACVGLELGHYVFKNIWPKPDNNICKVSIQSGVKNQKQVIDEACRLGEATNLGRFLVDLPPNILQPKNYAELLKELFSKFPQTKVDVWNEARLQKEKMGLHVAVGQAAEQTSHMVHVEYRGAGKEKSFAFVGKGITFDSGGLDIKPSQGMRLMKKDMGGSASVAGLAYHVIQTKMKVNCDFYFAIAENAVAKESFRPSDVLTSRNGTTVEIDNTDAEGRLVLADCLTVASEKKPQILIDIATLTGAIKVGLGSSTPGLFSNNDNLAESLLRSGQKRGDVVWRMPLVPEEKSRLKSDVADVVNSTSGYGGAVTAAWFLEMFTGGVPWAHFDIYAWNDSAKGPFGASGGSGQVIQALSHFLKEQSQLQKST